MVLKYIYTVFLGILLATFVGVGIAAFYPAPKYPEYNSYPKAIMVEPDDKIDATEAARLSAQERASQQISEDYRDLEQTYSKDVSVISLAFAIAILLISLTVLKNLTYIADGFLLGGVLTLLYSIIRGFGTEDNMFRFLIVASGLVIALVLGYIKLIRPAKKKV